jgi:hypothetical protein
MAASVTTAKDTMEVEAPCTILKEEADISST